MRMKIRLKTIMAGPQGTAGPGDVIDLPEAAALVLLKSGQASLAPRERVRPPAERATAEPAAEETVATPAAPPARRGTRRRKQRKPER